MAACPEALGTVRCGCLDVGHRLLAFYLVNIFSYFLLDSLGQLGHLLADVAFAAGWDAAAQGKAMLAMQEWPQAMRLLEVGAARSDLKTSFNYR